MTIVEDSNSVCSDKDEELEVKDKEPNGINDDDDEDDDEDNKDVNDEDDDEDEDDEDDEDEDEDEDDDEEFDPSVIQFELFKNFLMDDEGVNVATHLGGIAKELRTLNKILLKKNK